MTTPAQNVPAEFQDEIDLPAPGRVDQLALSKAQRDLALKNAEKRRIEKSIQDYEFKKKKSKDKWLDAKYQVSIDRYKKQLEFLGKGITGAQNKIYEAKGEYDKLLSGENRDAFMALNALFTQYGLGSLAGKIFDYVKQGYGADTIGLLLQDTAEYKERFAANETRTKMGLPVLSPAEYLSAESAYRQILSSAGLPKGFYDNPADFRNWIAGDVSPTEIKSRVDMAVEATGQANPAYKGALYQMYGISEADLTAYFLDRKVAEPILKKQAAAAAIGAAAIRRGFGADRATMEDFATAGISAQQAEEGYARIAESFESMLGIAGRYGSSWTQREAEQEMFTPGARTPFSGESAAEKGKRLRSQERAMFADGRGSSAQGLSAGYRQT